MLKVMLQKLWYKKWMSVSLFVGIALLTATAASFPMYRTAAYDRMLHDIFDQYYSENDKWPAINSFSFVSKKGTDGTSIDSMERLAAELHRQLGVTKREVITYYSLAISDANSMMNRDDVNEIGLRISFMSGLEEKVTLQAGELYSETGIDDDGCLEAIISQSCMVERRLLLGETLEFADLADPQGNPIRVKIVGIFGAADSRDPYWQVKPESMAVNCLIRESVFREYFTGDRAGSFQITCIYFPMWEYDQLKASDERHLADMTRYFTEESEYSSTFSVPPYLSILDSYERKQARIDAALFLLQVPIWILLGAFLFMISTQMYELESNEISVMKSRGGSGQQIFRLYLYQSVFLALLGAAAGLPLGRLFAEVLGATRSFLEFQTRRTLKVTYTHEIWLYVLAAMAGCVLMIALPAIRHSRLTIVKLKQQKAERRFSWWELCFLDIILLAVSLYEYRSFSRKEAQIETSAFLGEPMDPLLYISSSMFIMGLGLLLLRLQPLLVGLLFRIGKRFWGPASYISFMENRKNGRKQQFIMLFLILSISLGMFHSTAARTILQNAKENTFYIDGADRIIREIWRDNSSALYEGEEQELMYYEPDYDKYRQLPGAKSYTKVVYDTTGRLTGTNGNGQRISIMGIHTKQFGEIAYMQEGLMEKHYYEYLNELADEASGALVSASFRDLLGFKVGDTISFANRDGNRISLKIVDFVEYWPGYKTYVMTFDSDGSVRVTPQYLVIANIAALTKSWGTVPYEVWISNSGEEIEGFRQWIEEENAHLMKYVDRQADMDAVEEEPLLQGTNGILTMGFLMTMLLCAAGYLLYWVLAIRSREMFFGVLRAKGMRKGEIFHLLINEQIFCGGFCVIAGSFIGILASKMFVPILQIAYAASDQVLPIRLITQDQDMVRLLSVIGAVMTVCLVILVVLVRTLNVAKALKLGED